MAKPVKRYNAAAARQEAKYQNKKVELKDLSVRCEWCRYPHSLGCIYCYPMCRERDIRKEEAKARGQEQA